METSFYLNDDPPSFFFHASNIDPKDCKDRANRCLVGLTSGYAVVIALEFASRPSTEEETVTDMEGNGREWKGMEGNNDLYITNWAGETYLVVFPENVRRHKHGSGIK